MQEKFVKKSMKRITERITEKDLWVDGGYYSEIDMDSTLHLSATLWFRR